MKISLLFLWILICLHVFAQESFITQKKGLYDYNTPRDMVIKPNGNILFLFTSKPFGSTEIYTNCVYEINGNGEVVDSISYTDTSHRSVEFEHCCFSNDTLYLFGDGYNFGTPQETFLFMLKLDTHLNIIGNYAFSPGWSNIDGTKAGKLKLIDNQFYYISAAHDYSTSGTRPFCVIISKQGQLLDFKMDMNLPGITFNLFDFVYHSDDNGYKIFEGVLGFQGIPQISGLISHYSRDFQREYFSVLPYNMTSFLNYQPVNDSVYYLAGEWWDWSSTEIKRAGILKLMNDTTILCEYLHSTVPDSTSCPAFRNSLEILPDGNLIFCFTDNIDLELLPSIYPTKINLMKLTPELEVVWHRYIGGDNAKWDAFEMHVNEQEEIVIHAAYNIADISQYLDRDVLFIKTNSEGIITGTNDNIPGVQSSEALLYPNPAHDVVAIEFSMAYTGASLEICNISGQKVLATQLIANRQRVDISGIAPGTYVYRVFNKQGLDESGKLVVE